MARLAGRVMDEEEAGRLIKNLDLLWFPSFPTFARINFHSTAYI
jgi:hypothetical protein